MQIMFKSNWEKMTDLTIKAFVDIETAIYSAADLANKQSDVIRKNKEFDLSDILKLVAMIIYIVVLFAMLVKLINKQLLIENPKPQLLLTEKAQSLIN